MLSVSFLANAKYENLIQKLFHIFQGNSQVIIEQLQWWICLNCGFLETISQVHSTNLSFGQQWYIFSFNFYQSNACTYFKKSNSISRLIKKNKTKNYSNPHSWFQLHQSTHQIL